MKGQDYSVLPEQNPLKVSLEDTPAFSEGDSFQARHPVITNDWILSHARGEPGYSSDWHTHMPEMHQIGMPIEGEFQWRYRDNDGRERTFRLSAGEVGYLPGGMENKIEIVGDTSASIVMTYPHLPIMGVEQLFESGDSSRDENTQLDITGLWYDPVRDEVAYEDDDAVID